MEYYSSTSSDVRRIVLIGKTGSGKSSAANTILGREAFVSEMSAKSVTSECQKVKVKVGENNLAVIDTPGLFDTESTNEDVWKEISKCIGMSSPGPHAFLMVVALGRFTEEEKVTVEMIQNAFGEDADKYTMVLFTHGDRLKKKSIEQFVSENEALRDIIQKCYGHYHVFNNEAKKPSQVSDLLEKIDKMVKGNSGTYYTSEMYQKAEEKIEQEKERILKEKESQRKRELEGLKRHYEGEMLKMKIEIVELKHQMQARDLAERRNTILPQNKKKCVIL